MSELTYKKIVDVEQVETLNDAATVFINDDGAMKQVAANEFGLGTVKTVNGIEPDENGDIKSDSAFREDMLVMNGQVMARKTASEISNAIISTTKTPIIACSVMGADYSTGPRYIATSFEDRYIGELPNGHYVRVLHFDGKIAPIIVDGTNNTITLDPDWVAPEADPEPTGVHQMLVTDADGSIKWEDRTHYSEYVIQQLVNPTISKQQLAPGFYMYSTSYLPDFPLELGAQCTVEMHGVKYECEVLEYGDSGTLCIGNRYLQNVSAFEDTGEPFFFNTLSPGGMVMAFFSSSIEAPDTVNITGPIKIYTQIPAEYIAGLHNGEGMGSVVFGGGNTATGSAAFVEGAGNAAGGYAAHAEGCYTIADGSFSHAEGEGTIANGYAQHVDGKYNIEDPNNQYIHIAGNGVVDRGVATRSNAHTLDWSGNAWYQGDVYVGGTSQADGSKLVTEDDVNALIDSKLGVIENGTY